MIEPEIMAEMFMNMKSTTVMTVIRIDARPLDQYFNRFIDIGESEIMHLFAIIVRFLLMYFIITLLTNRQHRFFFIFSLSSNGFDCLHCG